MVRFGAASATTRSERSRRSCLVSNVARNFEIFNEINDAIRLLRDPELVWSADMQSIKGELTRLLEYSTTDAMMARLVAPLATAITDSEMQF